MEDNKLSIDVDASNGFNLLQLMSNQEMDDNKVCETFEDTPGTFQDDLIRSLKSQIILEKKQLQTTTITGVLNDDFPNNKINNQIFEDKNSLENELFLSLKFHIDSQYKLNQLNQSRIRWFERFRRYCQRMANFGDDDDETKFDLEQFRNEYNRFDRNYRYWRKRVRKLRKETKFSLSNRYQNPYDALYELFAKIECFKNQSKDNNLNTNEISFEDSSAINNCGNSPNIQCDIKEVLNEREKKLVPNRPRGRPPKTKVTKGQVLISLNLIESSKSLLENVPVSNDISAEESEFSRYSSDSSYDISKVKSVRGRKKNVQAMKSKAVSKHGPKKDKVEAKTKSSKKNVVRLKQDTSDLDKTSKKKKLTTERKVYHCDYEGCQYSTSVWSNLKTHKVFHSDERPFQCDKCDKSYKMKAALNVHHNVHEGKRFECTFEGCNLHYSMVRQLQKHIKIVHTKEAPLLHCDWEGCQYSTYRAENLRTHQKIHKGQRTYKCPHCEMAFNAPSTLWSHRLKHENIGGFKCDFKGCQFSTHRKATLKNHQLTHFEERLFSCAWPGCGDSFKTASGLATHKLMHANLRRHKCTWDGCSYASNLSSSLKSHIDQVHEKKKRNRKPKIVKNLLDTNLESRLSSGILNDH